MAKVTIPAKTVQQLDKWRRSFASVSHRSHVVFLENRMQMTNGFVGVESAAPGITGAIVSAECLFGPALSAAQDVTLEQKDEQIILTAGSFRATLPPIAEGSVPEWPALTGKAADWIKVPVEWWEALQQVIFAAPDKTGVQPHLDGVWWQGKMVIAGDGTRVARAAAPAPPQPGFVPRRLIDTCRAAPAPPTAVLWRPDRIWARFADGTTVWALLPVEPWPAALLLPRINDLTQMAGSKPWASWDGAGAAAAVNRVAFFAAERVQFCSHGKSAVMVTVKTPLGTATEQIPAQVTKDFKEDVSPILLADAMQRAPSVAFATTEHAALFRRPGFEMVVMLMLPL